nr:hypothetical protein CFP56_38969 [Quercus suber]
MGPSLRRFSKLSICSEPLGIDPSLAWVKTAAPRRLCCTKRVTECQYWFQDKSDTYKRKLENMVGHQLPMRGTLALSNSSGRHRRRYRLSDRTKRSILRIL